MTTFVLETTAEERANLRKHGECAPLTAFYGRTIIKLIDDVDRALAKIDRLTAALAEAHEDGWNDGFTAGFGAVREAKARGEANIEIARLQPYAEIDRYRAAQAEVSRLTAALEDTYKGMAFDALAHEAKAREEERERIATVFEHMTWHRISPAEVSGIIRTTLDELDTPIRARSQS